MVTRSENVQDAQRKNAERTNQVIQALMQLGMPQENIQTAAFNIYPLYDYDDGKQIFMDYEVAHTLSVKHKGNDDAGQIIDVAVHQGVNRVAQIEFTVEGYKRCENEALRLAVLDAQRKAKTIATSLNVTVDLVPLKVNEQFAGSTNSPQTFAKMESGATTSIEPGHIMVRASLEAEFQY